MWAECGAACRGLGLRDPLAEVDEKARAGASPSSQVLELSFGRNAHFAPLRIVLRPDLSPKTVAAVVAAVGRGTAAAATFYRNEAVPREPPGQCGDILCGPYSLIQGRLPGLAGTPTEAMPIVRRGYVARIQHSDDFFIALADHEEWGHSFTVWGELHDDAGMATLEAIARLPYREQKAAGASTIMRLLRDELETSAAIVSQRVGPDSREPSGTAEAETRMLNTEL